MTSWSDLTRHLDERCSIGAAGDDWLTLTWRFSRAAGPAVYQHQRIDRIEAGGRSHVAVACAVASASQLGCDAALRHNAQLTAGALALVDETIVLRACLDLERLDLAVVDEVLEKIAHEAARLRVGVGGRPVLTDVAPAISHWV